MFHIAHVYLWMNNLLLFHTYIVCVNFFTIAIYTINFCRKRKKNSKFFLLVMTFKFIKYTRQSYKVLLDHGTNEFLFSNQDSDERPNQMRHAFRRIFWLCLSLCMFISAWCLPSIRKNSSCFSFETDFDVGSCFVLKNFASGIENATRPLHTFIIHTRTANTINRMKT